MHIDNYDPQPISVGNYSIWYGRDGALVIGMSPPYKNEQGTWFENERNSLRFERRAAALAFATALRAMAEVMTNTIHATAILLCLCILGCSGDFKGFGGGQGGTADGGHAGGDGGSGAAGGGVGGSGGTMMACAPGAPICDDNTATLCAPDGSGPLPDGQDCSTTLAVCALGVCTEDLLVYLPLDEGAGSATVDKASMSLGDVVACAWADGPFQYALDFNTAGAQVDMGDILNSIGFPLTLTAWVNADPSAVDMPLVRTDSDAPGNSAGAWLTLHPSGQISVGYGNAMGGTASDSYRDRRSAMFVPPGEWTHVAGVITSMNELTIYVGGADAGGALTGTAQTIGTTAGHFMLAAANWAGAPTQYLGAVDDVRIYNRALSSAEVAALVSARPTP